MIEREKGKFEREPKGNENERRKGKQEREKEMWEE